MHSTSASPILHGYSVIRISLDDDRNGHGSRWRCRLAEHSVVVRMEMVGI